MKFLTINFLFSLFALSALAGASLAINFEYHHYNGLTSLFKNYSTQYPNKTYLYSIGKSVLGRDLWVLAIADHNPQKHVLLRPEAKYIGNMHGNEAPNRELLIEFIDYMLNNQATDPSVDFLMKNTRIHLLPTMNPDGFEKSFVTDCGSVQGRYNTNAYDLNRNFPDHFEINTAPMQPETHAIINWLENNTFILSANMHEGSFVVNYPYDNYKNSGGISLEVKCDDDDVYKVMAMNYTANNIKMRDEAVCTEGENFVNGTTNGGKH